MSINDIFKNRSQNFTSFEYTRMYFFQQNSFQSLKRMIHNILNSKNFTYVYKDEILIFYKFEKEQQKIFS